MLPHIASLHSNQHVTNVAAYIAASHTITYVVPMVNNKSSPHGCRESFALRAARAIMIRAFAAVLCCIGECSSIEP